MVIITPIIQKFKCVLAAVGIGFVAALVLSINLDTRYIGLIIIVFVGFFLGAMAWHLIRQTDDIRRGKYSLETFAYAWKEAVGNCEPIPSTPQSLSDFRLGAWKQFLANVYHYFLH
jgi:hypothetical protein